MTNVKLEFTAPHAIVNSSVSLVTWIGLKVGVTGVVVYNIAAMRPAIVGVVPLLGGSAIWSGYVWFSCGLAVSVRLSSVFEVLWQ